MQILERARVEGWTDEQVIERVLAGETALYEIIMRRYNQRLYRVVIAILRDSDETEDVMQDAYVRAYQHLSQFQAAPLSRLGLPALPFMRPSPAFGSGAECSSSIPRCMRERFP